MANKYQDSIKKAEDYISLIQKKLDVINNELIEFKELIKGFSL